jgi:hypothetical protein
LSSVAVWASVRLCGGMEIRVRSRTTYVVFDVLELLRLAGSCDLTYHRNSSHQQCNKQCFVIKQVSPSRKEIKVSLILEKENFNADDKIDFKKEFLNLTFDDTSYLLRMVGHNYINSSAGRNVFNGLLHRFS